MLIGWSYACTSHAENAYIGVFCSTVLMVLNFVLWFQSYLEIHINTKSIDIMTVIDSLPIDGYPHSYRNDQSKVKSEHTIHTKPAI